MNNEVSKSKYLYAPRRYNIKLYIRFYITLFEKFLYRIALDMFHPRKTIEKKYKISICSIFKNEAQYIKEWIEFHKIVGVDHFYLYNNNSNDNFRDVLEPYISDGLVTLIEWPMAQGQIPAYNNCIENYSSETKWIGFIDLDEFVVPNHDNTIYDFLSRFEKNRPVVFINWKIFCSSGKISRDKNNLVTEDFFVCWDKYSDVGKCFFNTKYLYNSKDKRNKLCHHSMWGKYKGINLPMVNVFNRIVLGGFHSVPSSDFPIQINHYFTKSYEEYYEKKSKGDVYYEKNPHDDDYFFAHESFCNSTDWHIYKYLIKLKLAMGIDK